MKAVASVSVIIPVYNEEKYIEKCIESLLLQDYPKADMEWIFVDGCSGDRTVEIIEGFAKDFPDLIFVCENKKKIVPCAMNLGIARACGKYIVRLDAHAEYAPDYISECIRCLESTDAENVGGVAETKAHGFVGNAIARMLSSKFGVGNSQFRTNGQSGYVDTVPFGAFKREVFRKYGGYDERLVRNQDNEMNYRIRKNGGKIYLSDKIHLAYYCRDSVKGISQMARKNGMWNVITMKLCPGSMGVRHFIPLAFVLSVAALALLGILHWSFWCCLGLELLLYLALDLWFSLKSGKSFRERMLLTFLFPVFHIMYGFGSVYGLIRLCSGKYSKDAYKPQSI